MPTTTVADPTQQPLDINRNKIFVPKVQVSPYGSSAVWNQDDGWLDLGFIDPDTLKFDFNKDKHDVMIGSPQYVANRFVTGMSGKVDFTLGEISPRAIELALGHNIGETVNAVTSSSGTVAASPAPTTTTFTYASAIPSALPSAGDTIRIVTTDPVLTTRTQYATVQSCDGSGNVVLAAALEIAPTAGDAVVTVDYILHYIGGNYFKNWRSRIILSATDNSLHIVELLKANITTGFQLQTSNTKHASLPVSLECLGQTQTISGRKQLVLAKYYEKPSMVLG